MPQQPFPLNSRAQSARGVGPIKTITGTTYTLTPSDIGRYLRFTNSGAVTFTIPANVDAPLPVEVNFNIIQAGAGQVTITAAGGVTLNSAGGLLATAAQFAVATLVKVAADEWDVMGNLA